MSSAVPFAAPTSIKPHASRVSASSSTCAREVSDRQALVLKGPALTRKADTSPDASARHLFAVRPRIPARLRRLPRGAELSRQDISAVTLIPTTLRSLSSLARSTCRRSLRSTPTGSPSSAASSSRVRFSSFFLARAVQSVLTRISCSPRAALLRPAATCREAAVQQRVGSRDAPQGGVCACAAGEGGTEAGGQERAKHASDRRCRHTCRKAHAASVWDVGDNAWLSVVTRQHLCSPSGTSYGSFQQAPILLAVRRRHCCRRERPSAEIEGATCPRRHFRRG